MLVRIAAVVVALTLSGCAQLAARYELQDLTKAQVLVDAGAVVVTQEPLVVSRNPSDGKTSDTVSWDVGTSGALFAAQDGVTIDAYVKPLVKDLNAEVRRQLAARPMRETSQVGQIKCTVNPERTAATCTLPRSLKSGFYAYTLRLMQGTTRLELDPTVMLE
ncbi:MAG: hypothetical protein U5L03_11470 [Burkholderiaceae bacterium]|nr:hypothetical protein [Burkholderiaceae bacterium]